MCILNAQEQFKYIVYAGGSHLGYHSDVGIKRFTLAAFERVFRLWTSHCQDFLAVAIPIMEEGDIRMQPPQGGRGIDGAGTNFVGPV